LPSIAYADFVATLKSTQIGPFDVAPVNLFVQTILTETTAIGLRFRTESRLTLQREQVLVDTPWGEIVAKKVHTPAGPRSYPEYEACRQIAESAQVPLQAVYNAVTGARKEADGRQKSDDR
jgi:uncharacterized protein (DUF111 family)